MTGIVIVDVVIVTGVIVTVIGMTGAGGIKTSSGVIEIPIGRENGTDGIEIEAKKLPVGRRGHSERNRKRGIVETSNGT